MITQRTTVLGTGPKRFSVGWLACNMKTNRTIGPTSGTSRRRTHQPERLVSCKRRTCTAKQGKIVAKFHNMTSPIPTMGSGITALPTTPMTATITMAHQYSERAARPRKVQRVQNRENASPKEIICWDVSFICFSFLLNGGSPCTPRSTTGDPPQTGGRISCVSRVEPMRSPLWKIGGAHSEPA